MKEGSSSDGSKKYGNGLPKKKEHSANAISQDKHRRLSRNSQCHKHVVSVTLVINSSPVAQAIPSYQPCFQQCTNQHNYSQRHVQFDQILMTYVEFFYALIQKNWVQTRIPLAVLRELLWWYKDDQYCAFHRGAPNHDIENYFALKAEVRRLM